MLITNHQGSSSSNSGSITCEAQQIQGRSKLLGHFAVWLELYVDPNVFILVLQLCHFKQCQRQMEWALWGRDSGRWGEREPVPSSGFLTCPDYLPKGSTSFCLHGFCRTSDMPCSTAFILASSLIWWHGELPQGAKDQLCACGLSSVKRPLSSKWHEQEGSLDVSAFLLCTHPPEEKGNEN